MANHLATALHALCIWIDSIVYPTNDQLARRVARELTGFVGPVGSAVDHTAAYHAAIYQLARQRRGENPVALRYLLDRNAEALGQLGVSADAAGQLFARYSADVARAEMQPASARYVLIAITTV